MSGGGINRLVPHNTKQDGPETKRCRGGKIYIRKKRIAISGIERSLRLGLISFHVYFSSSSGSNKHVDVLLRRQTTGT